MKERVNVAVFVSGNGSNLGRLIEKFQAGSRIAVALVISNKSDAYALVRAEAAGIPNRVVNKTQLNESGFLLPLLDSCGIDFIVLAGFLLKAPDFLLERYPRRVINLHPALLPKFGGKGMYGHYVHEAVKAAGEIETGMTVHYVSGVIDGGEIIAQFKTPLLPADGPEDIARKEHELEMRHFPQVVEEVVKKEFGLE